MPSSTGWIWTHCVARNDLEFLILCLHLPSAGVTGMCHHTRRIRNSAKHSANWATFPASRFSYMYLCFITSAFYHIALLTPWYINPIRAGELIGFIHLTLSRAKNSARDTVVFNIQSLFVQRAHTKEIKYKQHQRAKKSCKSCTSWHLPHLLLLSDLAS